MSMTRRTAGLGFIGGLAGLVLSSGAARAADDDSPPNVFISPCGEPFRAKLREPYPVAAWFKQTDKNGDGRIDHAEFLADAEAFFHRLDLDHDGLLSSAEVETYEQSVAPEVLGYNYQLGAVQARVWLAQAGGGEAGVESDPEPNTPPPKHHADESGQGASPYSFFDEPEPVAAADLDFDGRIKLPNFLKLADSHFQTLDREGRGYLTLDRLPRTPAQDKVQAWLRHHRAT